MTEVPAENELAVDALESPVVDKHMICASCDIACPVVAKVRDGRVIRIRSSYKPSLRENICVKGIYAHKGFENPARITHPLKRVGERGSGKWQQVTWEDALDDIAQRLTRVVDRYGPEALAVATSEWNTSVDNGAGRRFMNLLGSPNWISGVALCAGNTAAINRMVYGWFPNPDFGKTDCIVLFGHNPKKHSWTPVYNKIRKAQARGAKLIVMDPRRSENAELADVWLPLRAGTDAAMAFGWLNVIIEEELYDRAFVDTWTVGFDALKQRAAEYPLERVAAITGVDAQLIRQAARMYAQAKSAIIPWTPITDQQLNSTSAIRLQCTLRALTGNIDVPGGELLQGFNPDIVSQSELELHESLSDTQKAKQLGADTHPAFTYRGMAALGEPTARVWGREYANLMTGCYMANPLATFKAMADGVPYPVKAFISLGNNTMMGLANLQTIYRAMMNQDLIVVHEHVKTPTAQLADYILPGDSWLERPLMYEAFGWTATVAVTDKAIEPPGECRSVYTFWHDLAARMGLGASFPWATLEDVYDYRLRKLGVSFREFVATRQFHAPAPQYRKYETTGFATPSGKVELYSSVLESLNFDPLPYYREAPGSSASFPLMLFMGVRDDPFFQTGQRHIPELRRLCPEPKTYLHADDARSAGIEEGEWIELETASGKVRARAEIRDDMPRGLVRIPHGWWLPESQEGKENLSGAWVFSDAMVTSDDEAYMDREQGIPHLKGLPCRILKVDKASATKLVVPQLNRTGAGA
ncbi:molybdopterin-containing oxidoreductase family protein [Trinickia mobilis]|uniref:molybdopterin-containing oxidoreductase family protein n=1 Tax=Trinickia mobilis TaxID=2816356 RepID=UPI001A8D32C2|nr:molybdopterin-dependent oxidoreductase [Trinickia mobilis]